MTKGEGCHSELQDKLERQLQNREDTGVALARCWQTQCSRNPFGLLRVNALTIMTSAAELRYLVIGKGTCTRLTERM